MVKELSAGFVVIDKATGKLLACHPTGRPYKGHCFDVPKGHVEAGENPRMAACRELLEETGLSIADAASNIVDLGQFAYRPDKDLHLSLWNLKTLTQRS